MPFRIGSVLLVGFALLLSAVSQRTPSNPALPTERSLFTQASVPPSVAGSLRKACSDCHSNATVWPWYVHVPVVSTLLVREVERARQEMNFSDWQHEREKGPEELAARLSGICENLLSGAMPKHKYLWIHPTAKLSPSQVAEVCSWTDKQQTALLRQSDSSKNPRR